MSRYSPGLRFRQLPNWSLIAREAAGWFLRLTAYRPAAFNVENVRLLGFLRLPFAQAYPGPTAVFINELNARGLECAANSQIIRRCQRGLAVSYLGTENGVSP
jgi:hypothetical protein